MNKIMVTSLIIMVLMAGGASALPEILNVFDTKYNTFDTKLDSCDTCHIPSLKLNPIATDQLLSRIFLNNSRNRIEGLRLNALNLNPYGIDLNNNLNIGISQALSKIENLDSDNDGFSNIDEINNLTNPGDKQDHPIGKKIIKKFRNLKPFGFINYSMYMPPK